MRRLTPQEYEISKSIHAMEINGELHDTDLRVSSSSSNINRIPSNNSLSRMNSIHSSSSLNRLDASGEGIRGRAPSVSDSVHGYNRVPTDVRSSVINGMNRETFTPNREALATASFMSGAEAAAVAEAEAKIAAVIARGKYDPREEEQERAEKKCAFCRKVLNEVFFTGDMPNYKAYLFDMQSTSVLHLLLFWIDVVLRGIAQVYLCDHPLTGVLVLFGLLCTSAELVGYSLLGTLFSTLGALWLCRPPISTIQSGLCGYDGALVGCACLVFLDTSNRSAHVAVTIILSLCSGFVHVACSNLLQTFLLPTFTFSFNLTTIAFLLSLAQKKAAVISFAAPAAAPFYASNYTDFSAAFMWDASIRGVGQFMFADTTAGGILIILGIACSSRMGALAAWGGATTAALTAYWVLQVPPRDLIDVRNGLFGYNSAGTCASLAGGVFYNPSVGGTVFGIVGAAFAVLLVTMFKAVLGGLFGLPVLTFPFICSTWIMLFTKSSLLVPYPSTGTGPVETCESRLASFALSLFSKQQQPIARHRAGFTSSSILSYFSLSNHYHVDREQDEYMA